MIFQQSNITHQISYIIYHISIIINQILYINNQISHLYIYIKYQKSNIIFQISLSNIIFQQSAIKYHIYMISYFINQKMFIIYIKSHISNIIYHIHSQGIHQQGWQCMLSTQHILAQHAGRLGVRFAVRVFGGSSAARVCIASAGMVMKSNKRSHENTKVELTKDKTNKQLSNKGLSVEKNSCFVC